MFDELAERSLMCPLVETKHTYVGLAIVKFSHLFEIVANTFHIHDL